MIRSVLFLVLLVLPYLFILSVEAKTLDPYKVLGVEKSANQRDIQKAFHRLSLKYHPDKNKNKGAQEKFAEINNAYEILSDEDKRKNYDLYGDTQGNTGFDERNFGNRHGSTYFTSGGPGGEYFTSGPGGWQTTSGQGNARSFSFSFGGDSSAGGSPFGFDMGDIFSNFFRTSGNRNGNYHSGFSSSDTRSNSESSSVNIQDIDLAWFNMKIRDQGMTWFLLFYTPSTKGYNTLESVISDVANSLHGALKAGKINCQTEQALCRELDVSSARSGRLFIYGYGSNGMAYLLEYNGEFDARSLKSFCQDHLPRISKRVDLSRFEFTGNNENLPQVLLLTTKKETPVMWRAISGLYRKRFAFYDAELSRKTLVRKQNQGLGHGDSISYSLLDAKKQPQILSSFDRSGFKSLDAFILSYKPRKGKFAAHTGELTMEEAEKFVSSVLNGDVVFSMIHQNPTFR